MTIEEVFKEGLRLTREAMGLPKGNLDIKGTDIPVLAAYTLFNARSKGKDTHPDFPTQGPQYAKLLILRAFAKGEHAMKPVVLKTLKLLKAIHDDRENAGALIPGPLNSREIVLLAPATLAQLNQAIEEAEQHTAPEEA